jgi:shikimate kinase
MGVGKSSVARHLARKLDCTAIDLDEFIEKRSERSVAAILDSEGEAAYRRIETAGLKDVLQISNCGVLSLGGGTWTIEENRELIKASGITTIWLESSFEHCWRNIRKSRKERPLARDRAAAKSLFDKRQSVYCLSDWHFLVRPGLTSFDVAEQILDEVFGGVGS